MTLKVRRSVGTRSSDKAKKVVKYNRAREKRQWLKMKHGEYNE